MSRVAGVWRWVLILGPILVMTLAFQALWTLRVTSARPDDDDMSVEAGRVAGLVDAYIKRVAGVTSFLTLAPEVVKLAEDSSKLPLTPADREIETNWGKQAGNERFDAIQAQPVSMFFKDLTAVRGAFREIFLTDTEGRVIAASNRTENYLQANEHSWWPKHPEQAKASCRRLPQECVRITDVEWDASAAVFGYAVVLPVLTPAGQWVGVLKAVVDPGELDTLLKFASSRQRAEIVLVNAQGKPLLSHDPFFDPEAASLLGGLSRGQESSLHLTKGGPLAFVRRLSSPLDGGWVVAVTDRGQGEPRLWQRYVLWCLLTLVMFVIAARAFAVTVPRGDEIRSERTAS